MNHVLANLQDIRSLAELGEPVDVEALRKALKRIPQVAPQMSRNGLEALKVEVDRIFELAEGQRDDIAQRLDELHRGRTVAQGYNTLQAHHTAQRLSKRA